MARQALVVLMVVIVFGTLVPIYKGIGFLDPRIIAAYACLALLFVAPASAELAATRGKGAPASGILGRIAIIGVSGRGDDEAASRAAGADAFLVKPVSPRALATALLEATRHAAAAT